MDTATEKSLRHSLKIHAHALGIPSGSAEVFIDRTISATQKILKEKSRQKITLTKQDLTRIVTKELKKYNTDLAYVYQNYATII